MRRSGIVGAIIILAFGASMTAFGAEISGPCLKALQESISETRTNADGTPFDSTFQTTGITLFREPTKKILAEVIKGKSLTQINDEQKLGATYGRGEADKQGVGTEVLEFPAPAVVSSVKMYTDRHNHVVDIQETQRVSHGEDRGITLKFKWMPDGECVTSSIGTVEAAERAVASEPKKKALEREVPVTAERPQMPYASLDLCSDPILLHYKKKLVELKSKDEKIEEINGREDKAMGPEVQRLTRLENDLNFKYDKDKDREKINQLRKSMVPLKEKLVKDAMTYNEERLKLIPDLKWIDQGLPEAKNKISQYLKDRFEYYSYVFNSDQRDQLKNALLDIKDPKNPQDDEIGFLDRHPTKREDLSSSLRETFKVIESTRRLCEELGFDDVLGDKATPKSSQASSRRPTASR